MLPESYEMQLTRFRAEKKRMMISSSLRKRCATHLFMLRILCAAYTKVAARNYRYKKYFRLDFEEEYL